ncbi:MAG: hypothetical protein ACLP9L_39720 [Thermoguttaceae bacterium]
MLIFLSILGAPLFIVWLAITATAPLLGIVFAAIGLGVFGFFGLDRTLVGKKDDPPPPPPNSGDNKGRMIRWG